MRLLLRFAAVATLITAFVAPASAQTKPVKGNWIFTINTPLGVIPQPITFRTNGKGVADLAGTTVDIVYREDATRFSVSIEIPGSLSATGQPLTLVLRGVKTTDTSAVGAAVMITEIPDPSAPGGFMTINATFVAERQ